MRSTVLPEYDRRLQAAFETQGEVSLLNRFKRAKGKKKNQPQTKQMADGSVSYVRLPNVEASVSDDEADKIAMISVEGPLLNKACWMYTDSGPILIIDGYDRIEATLSKFAADETVKGIFVRGDTPGGMVTGCFELAEKIKAWTSEKPILWYNESLTCSAGYALASACTEIHALKTALTGSIGVVYARYDYTGAMDQAGVSLTIFKSDEKKDHGNPETEMSDQESKDNQTEIDALADMFRGLVSEHRPLSIEDIKGFAAGTFMSAQAQSHNLIDGQTDLQGAVSRLTELASTPTPSTDPIPAPAPEPVAVSKKTAAKQSTQKQETPMSKSIARHRASLKFALLGAASTMALKLASDADEDELNAAMDDEAEKELDAMDEEDITSMDEDDDVSAMDEDEDLEAMDEDELEAMDEEEETEAKAAFKASASRIARSAVATVTAASTPAPKPTGDPAKDAVAAERARSKAIMALPEATGKEALAAEMAAEGVSVEGAKRMLAKAPKASKRAFNPPSPKLGTGKKKAGSPSESPLLANLTKKREARAANK